MAKNIDADRLKAKLDEHYRKYQSKYMETRTPYTQGLVDALDLAEQVIDSLQQEQSCDTCTNDKGCVTCKDGELWEGKEQPSEDLTTEIEKYFQGLWPGMETAEQCNTDMHFTPPAIMRLARHFYILGLKNNIPVTQITLDELAKEGEPVSKDLEEAAEEYRRKTCNEACKNGFLDNHPSPSIKTAFIAGAEWQKEQMIRDCSVQASYEAEIEKAEERGYNLCKEQMLNDAVKGTVCKDKKCVWIELVPNALPDYEDIEPVKCVVMKED